jgi:hypothetical protein
MVEETDLDKVVRMRKELSDTFARSEVATKEVISHFTKDGSRVDPDSELIETLEVFDFAVPPGYVEANYGLTLNLGNYESARCDVTIKVPCYVEEMDRALKFASSKAEKVIQDEVVKIKGPRK